MDQLLVVISGTFITVICYVLSPIKLSAKILGLIERFGKGAADIPGTKTQKARSYYVRHLK